jgi:hypothetical protein
MKKILFFILISGFVLGSGLTMSGQELKQIQDESTKVYKGYLLDQFRDQDLELDTTLWNVAVNLWYIKLFGWTNKVSKKRFEFLRNSLPILQKKLNIIDNTVEYAKHQASSINRNRMVNNPDFLMLLFVVIIPLWPYFLAEAISKDNEISAQVKNVRNAQEARTDLAQKIATIEKILKYYDDNRLYLLLMPN